MTRNIASAFRTRIVTSRAGLRDVREAERPGVVSTEGQAAADRHSAGNASDPRDLSSAAGPGSTAFSAAITTVGRPACKATTVFRVWVRAAASAGASTAEVAECVAAEEGGKQMRKRRLTTYAALVFAMAPATFAQERFDSADAAAQAAIEGAEKHDTARLAAIFGPQGNAILTSGKPEQDRAEQAEFSKLAREKHELITDPRNPNRVILSIGDEDWPFPVPIVRSKDKWSFDASQAGVEMQARRIGTDELDAIEICAGYVEAQRKYASEDHDKDGVLKYASQMMSTGDRHDGLYRAAGDEPLVPRGLVDATWDGSKKATKPYHGYYFRILDGQGPHAPGGAHSYRAKDRLMGGFGLVAWPAEYGVSGIHTLIVNQDGVIYQKDIAPLPGGAPPPITRYDPDPSWSPVD